MPARGSPVVFAPPRVGDATAIHTLIAGCRPLDLNSTYAYLLLCEHFADTCVRAEQDGETVGFVSAYRPPRQADTLFVWQVAVSARLRGQGVAGRMLRELLARPGVRDCRCLETTVSPSNGRSMRLFHALARELRAPVAEQVMFQEEDFGSERHESETLVRIGPFRGPHGLHKGERPHEP
jgi:L-2,4-diaminobutyric acid acetyltransferase